MKKILVVLLVIDLFLICSMNVLGKTEDAEVITINELKKITITDEEKPVEEANEPDSLFFTPKLAEIKHDRDIYNDFSEEEITLICRVVETETYDQAFDSKVNVANVVFNRLNDGRFGDTIKDVVTAPKQFAYGRKVIADDTLNAVIHAYENEDTTQGALFFHSFKEARVTFCGADYIFSDNAVHHFYR